MRPQRQVEAFFYRFANQISDMELLSGPNMGGNVWKYVKDCLDCLYVLSKQYHNLDKRKNYHITNFQWTTILDVANIVSQISGAPIEIGTCKDDTQMNSMNEPDEFILKFWTPKTSIVDGIKIIYNS